MKSASDQLFFLIKSLTKSEKKYFHQFANRYVKGQRNNYLNLFEAIGAQKVYDEESLKKQFQQEKFVTYFPVAKQYLYNQILDSLHQFHLASSVSGQVRKNLHVAEILLEKNLLNQAQKLLIRSKSKIVEYQLFSLMPDCLLLERQAWDQQFYKNTTEDAPDAWKKNMQQALQAIQQETEFAFFNSMIRRWHFQKITLSQSEEKLKMTQLVADFQKKTLSIQNTLRSKIDYFRAMSTYYFMEAKPLKAYEYNHQLLKLFEQNPSLLELYPQKYLSALNNFLIDNHQLKRFETLEAGIQKLRMLPEQKAFKKIPSLRQKVFELSTLLELNALIDQHQFAKALLQLPIIEETLLLYKNKISKHYQLTFYYLIGLIYFENQQFEQCQTWLNYLFQNKAKNILEELFRFANLLKLLTHYELGHYELLSHLLPSIKRKHQQQNQLFKTEVLLFRLLKNLSNAKDKQEEQLHFKNFKAAIMLLLKDEDEKRVFNYFDWVRWVKGHIA